MSKELAVVNDDSELLVLDEGDEGGSGIENVTGSDQLVPRLQIAAGTSKQVMKGHEKHIAGLQVGEIFNTVSKEIIGDAAKVIPVWYSKNRILFDKDWKIECSSPNGIDGGKVSPECSGCEYSQWASGKDGVGFACTEFRNFAVILLDADGMPTLASVSFKSTSSGMAKTWVNMIDARKAKTAEGKVVKLPMYLGYYTLTPSPKDGKKGVFYVWAVNNAGGIDTRTDDGKSLAALGKKTYLQFKNAEKKLEGDSE